MPDSPRLGSAPSLREATGSLELDDTLVHESLEDLQHFDLSKRADLQNRADIPTRSPAVERKIQPILPRWSELLRLAL